jgi:hypothetical protein
MALSAGNQPITAPHPQAMSVQAMMAAKASVS